MMFNRFSLPRGWPKSMWFFIATAVVFLLQLIPYTGVFLMIVGGPFWSVILINLGMIGIVLEVITFRVFFLWLSIPLLYFGGYHLAYTKDQRALAQVSRDAVAFNKDKALPFDPARQDMVLEDPRDGLGIGAGGFVEKYGLARAFDSHGRVFLIGSRETCQFIRDKPVFLSAGIQARSIQRPTKDFFRRQHTGFCTIIMPGKPDKPTVRIIDRAIEGRQHGLPVVLRQFRIRDDARGVSTAVRSGRAGPLKRIPMPAMGCALNSGAPSWDCFAGFMRDDFTQVLPGMPRYASGAPIVAKALGLSETTDLARHAIGPERFKPMADKADADLVAKELAILEQMLADPLAPLKNGYFMHLPNKPEVIAPYATRIFAALQQTQSADRVGRQGRALWSLAAALPDDALEPHRDTMIAMMQPDTVKEWTTESNRIWYRLDAARPAERELLLHRLEARRTDYWVAASFCRLGTATPPDAKRRLLALWHKLGQAERGKDRPMEHIPLYLALARMGLKGEAGKVDQHYFGDDYRGIWREISPRTPASICDLETHQLSNRFRRF